MPRRSKQKPTSASQGKNASEEPVPSQGLLRCKLDKNLECMKTFQNVTDQVTRVEVPYDATTNTLLAEKLLPQKLEPKFLPVGIAGITNIEEALMVSTEKCIQGLVKIGPKTYLPFMKYDLAVNIKVAKGPIDLKSPRNVVYVGGQPVIKNKKLETGEVWKMSKGSMAAFSNFDDVEKVLSYQVCFPRRVPKDSIKSFRLLTAKRLGREEHRPNRDATSTSSSTCSTTEEAHTDADNMVPFLARKFRENCKVREVEQERRTDDDAGTDTDGILESVQNMRLASTEPEVYGESLPKTLYAANSRQDQPSRAYRTPEPTPRTDEGSQPSAHGSTKMKIRAMKVTETSEQTVTELIDIQSEAGAAVDIIPTENGGPWHTRVRYDGHDTMSKKRRHGQPKREESEEDPLVGAGPKSKREKKAMLVVNRRKVRTNVLSRTTPRKSRPSLSESVVSGTTATDMVLDTSEVIISSSSREANGLRQATIDDYAEQDPLVGAGPKSKREKKAMVVVNRRKVRTNVLSRTTPRKSRPSLSESVVSGTTATDMVLDTSEVIISSSSREANGLRQATIDDYAEQSEHGFVGLQADQDSDSLLTSDQSSV